MSVTTQLTVKYFEKRRIVTSGSDEKGVTGDQISTFDAPASLSSGTESKDRDSGIDSDSRGSSPRDDIFSDRPGSSPRDDIFSGRPGSSPRNEIFSDRPGSSAQQEDISDLPREKKFSTEIVTPIKVNTNGRNKGLV